MTEVDVELPGGRVLHAYDTGAPGDGRLTVIWHHGTPAVGAPPRPLLAPAETLGIRWVSYDRPGYGGSTVSSGRDIGTAAKDVAAVADALGVERFAVMGHSGGGPHALASASLLPDRVLAVVVVAGLAPHDAEGLHWFAGMEATAIGTLRATVEGREARAQHDAMVGPGRLPLTPADTETVAGEWGWITEVVAPAMVNGRHGQVDDDLAYVAYWGFELDDVVAPTLIVQGGEDRVVPLAHAEWLHQAIDGATLWVRPDAGHLSILDQAADALAWVARQATADHA